MNELSHSALSLRYEVVMIKCFRVTLEMDCSSHDCAILCCAFYESQMYLNLNVELCLGKCIMPDMRE